jgi:hypothetical protein
VVQVHADEGILEPGRSNRVDPDHWKPMIMSFRRLYSVGREIAASRLNTGPEELYAPWKVGGPRALLGKALATWSRHRYGGQADASATERKL